MADASETGTSTQDTAAGDDDDGGVTGDSITGDPEPSEDTAPGETGDEEPLPDPDAPAKLFSHDYLPVYRITMQGADWPQAWDHLLTQVDPDDKCAERPFSEASVIFENPWSGESEEYTQVGFRIRGHDLPEKILDQPDERFGFKMSFVHYMPGRQFHEHKMLNFLSSERDDTLMKQCLMYELLRDFDIPAPLCNFAAVYVNDEYVGVFAHVQERDDSSYRKNRFPDDPDGSMYELGDCLGDDEDALMNLGPFVEPYVNTYQIEAGTTEEDMLTDLIPFAQCASAAQQDFIGCIGDHIHLDEWQRAIAAHFAVPDMDGWAPSSSNFMLYHYGPQGSPRRFVVYPWDVDRTFKDDCFKNDDEGDNNTGPCHIMGQVWEDGASPVLVNRLRQPPFQSDFCAAVQAFVDQHFNPDAMDTRLSDLRYKPRQSAQPFNGLIAPSLDDLMQHDPLWDHDRFVIGYNEITQELLPDRHAALLEQLATCEISPLITN